MRAFLLSLALVAAARAQADPRAPPRREQFRVIYEWNTVDYEWPSPQAREAALNASLYVPRNVLISGIRHYKNTLYFTMPRLLSGVPATLGAVPADTADTAPKMRPFPSWEANELGNCSALQFAQNIEIDCNGIMWILDNGHVATLGPAPDRHCPPALVLLDLAGGGDMVRYRLPATGDFNSSYLNDLVVDNRADGDFAYITDNSAEDPGIIVFRRSDRKFWKVRDQQSMHFDPEATDFRVNGTSLKLNVNIDGLALGPQTRAAGAVDRVVYYSPLASFHLYAVNASRLRDESLAARGPDALAPHVTDLGTKSSQTDGMLMDAAGNLFYGLVGANTIAEWNTSTAFHAGQRTIARDALYIQWVDRFCFDDHGNLYVVVNRLFNYIRGGVSADDVNYRVLRAHVGSRSYVHGEDLTPPVPGAAGAATPPASLLASLLLLAAARLLV